MSNVARALLAGLLLLAIQTPAGAAPDRTQTMHPGSTAAWDGRDTVGTNLRYWTLVGDLQGTGACTKAVDSYCESILIDFENPVPQGDADGELERGASISIVSHDGVSDHDLRIYRSDQEGARGSAVASSRLSGLGSAEGESVGLRVHTTTQQPRVYYLMEVVYFAAASGYRATVTF